MRNANKINPHYLDDLILTSDGGVEVNMHTFLKRPEVQRRITLAGSIAKREIAKRQARMEREQNGSSATSE